MSAYNRRRAPVVVRVTRVAEIGTFSKGCANAVGWRRVGGRVDTSRHPCGRRGLDGRVRRDDGPGVVIEVNTLRAFHEHGYRVSVFCRCCARHICLDIPPLLAAGYGERAVVGLRVRCQVCGGRGRLSIL